LENTNLHKLLLRQLNKICKNGEETLERNKDFEKFLDSISKTYKEYDEHSYTLERSLELSFEELEALQLEQKNSYESQLRAMVNAMPDMMFLNDESGMFLEVFMKEESELLLPKSQIVGKKYKDIFPPKLATFFKKNLKKSLQTNKLNVIEYELIIKKKIKYYEARLIATEHLVNKKQTVISIVRNISKEKRTQNKLEYMAKYDDLTKLPNRFYFQKHLKKAIKDGKRKNIEGALFFLDIDQFKIINDNLGHDIGDKILLKITKRLKSILKKEIFLARFGGDEFVIIAENKSDFELRVLANTIMLLFEKRFKVDKYLLDITTSMGICTFPYMISSTAQLIKQADMAMYTAKDLGRNQYQIFTKELADKAYATFQMEVKLKKAIENDEFYLLYQPQIRLIDNKLIAVEALIRWQSDTLILPLKFIPLAEHCGYIEYITDWVMEEVCRQIGRWQKKGLLLDRVSINLSRQELGQQNLLSRIMHILEKYNVNSSAIEFEVTETALFKNTSVALKNISALREKGFVVAIDDFGTGYSSLSNLNEFLFDRLKIDRSFIMGINKKKESEYIIKATIAIAKSLNLKVLAEGVETLEELEFLQKYGCDEVQGYYYAKPLSADDILNFKTKPILSNYHI
jgi:diguanylate cyclase (GGDEF)-like protein/PAS domain S-box-containing protein